MQLQDVRELLVQSVRVTKRCSSLSLLHRNTFRYFI